MKQVFTDMMGRQVEMNFPPQRIVSLVPSQTELLCDLGLTDEVIGITKFCVHPQEWFNNKTRVGGTKQLAIEKIASLQPDLIIANKEENTQEQIEALAKRFPVWISDINTLEEALQMITMVGEITDRKAPALQLTKEIGEGLEKLRNKQQKLPAKKVAYFIWYRPWMATGCHTFIHDLLMASGWKNAFENRERYPEITPEQLREANPELVFLSSEPFPFKEKHGRELQEILPQATLKFVDGEMFSWYGSRMLKAIKYIQDLS